MKAEPMVVDSSFNESDSPAAENEESDYASYANEFSKPTSIWSQPKSTRKSIFAKASQKSGKKSSFEQMH